LNIEVHILVNELLLHSEHFNLALLVASFFGLVCLPFVSCI